MSFDALFSLSSSAAMVGWLMLIFLPRWPALLAGLSFGLIGALSLLYAVLVLVFFFRVDGGGFGSLPAVRALFMSDPVLLAGWVHYLAFDLFVGIFIARQSDGIGLSRLMQAPILLATFMFGPLGYLVFLGCRSASLLSPDLKGAA